MPLIIEDGTGVENANSYATLAELAAYCTPRGLTLPATDELKEKALILACDKLETYRYKGTKTDSEQPLLWPRQNVYVDDGDEYPLGSDVIPNRLKNAQCQLAAESAAGANLQPTGTGREIVKEKADVLEVQYAPTGSGTVTPQFNKAEDLLSPLLKSGGAFSLVTARA